MTRVGSLCSGVGGLELAVAAHWDATVAWQAEIDPEASKVLRARFPGVPNLGDLTGVDWAGVEPVDVLCAGFPCQPVSQAGLRAGIHDERWLFDDILAAVGRMAARPRLLVFENVRGLLTANGGDAMARVVQGLARSGCMGSWRTVRASDVGAPHRRERVFIVAADTNRGELQRRGGPDVMAGPGRTDEAKARQRERGWDATSDRREASADTDILGPVRGGSARRGWFRPANDPPASADVDVEGLERPQPAARHQMPAWGDYRTAIERWERILGRPAPRPADSRGRLNPTFVEWMMGLPAGWVTDLLGRAPALRCLGNAVVPQQAAHALRLLTAQHQVAA